MMIMIVTKVLVTQRETINYPENKGTFEADTHLIATPSQTEADTFIKNLDPNIDRKTVTTRGIVVDNYLAFIEDEETMTDSEFAEFLTQKEAYDMMCDGFCRIPIIIQ